MKSFRFYVDGIDSPMEFVKSFRAKSRLKAFLKASKKYGDYWVYYKPVPPAKRKRK